MGNYHGDEQYCNGNCGTCDNCDEQYYQASDDAYEQWCYAEDQ
jgi:hypothetical protein